MASQLSRPAKFRQTISIIGKEAKRYGRSRLSIGLEIIYIYSKISIGPNYYLLAGMADKKYPMQEKLRHLSDGDYHKAINVLNPRSYRKLTQHKLTEKSILELAHIRTQPFLGFYSPVSGFDHEGDPLKSLADLKALLAKQDTKKICLKLIEGWGGAGFYAGEVNAGDDVVLNTLHSGERLQLSELIARYSEQLSEGLLIETYLEQANSYSKYNQTSVNTVRVWIVQENQKVEVIGAYLRTGRVGSLVDNADAGGINWPVNLQSAELGGGVLANSPHRANLTAHPDSKLIIAGSVLPHWQEILAFSCEALRKLPNTRFAGLDIAMSETGPVLIEVNAAPDKDGAAYAQMAPRRLLELAKKA